MIDQTKIDQTDMIALGSQATDIVRLANRLATMAREHAKIKGVKVSRTNAQYLDDNLIDIEMTVRALRARFPTLSHRDDTTPIVVKVKVDV